MKNIIESYDSMFFRIYNHIIAIKYLVRKYLFYCIILELMII